MASGDRASTKRKDGGAKRKRGRPSQRAKFIETAKEIEADESGDQFERAIGRILSKKTRPG